MIIPGANLLGLAFGVIGRQTVAWSQFTGGALNAAGVRVPTWAPPVDIGGSFQPVPNTLIQALGLDWTKTYANFYAEADFTDVMRDKTGDRLAYAGKTYQILSKTDWKPQDGWQGVLCIEVTNA